MGLDRIHADAVKYRNHAAVKCNAHYKMCRVYNRRHNMIGIPAVVAGTVVGTTIFGGLNEKPELWVQIFTGSLAIIAVVLSSLQTFFSFPATSAHHKDAAVKYEGIRHDLDHLIRRLEITPPDEDDVKDTLGELYEITGKLKEVAQGAPPIRTGVYDEAKSEFQRDPLSEEVPREHRLTQMATPVATTSTP